MNKTDTAHQSWNTAWQSDAGRAGWIVPNVKVLETIAQLRLKGVKTGLDLGCGVGRHALAMAALGFETTAFDASKAGLAELEKQAKAHEFRVKTVEGMMTDLPFDASSFDYVLSFNVVYHGDLSVVQKTLSEITRVLKPGGTFQGTMLSKRRDDYGIGMEISRNTFVQPEGPGDKTHPHFFCNASELVELLADYEILSLEDVDDRGGWHWNFVAERKTL